jgi:hypothetical protein
MPTIRNMRPATPQTVPRSRLGRSGWLALSVGGAVLVTGSAAVAATAVLVRGEREIVSQPLTGDLQVVDARLEPWLIPGAASDLVVRVRNRGAKPVTLDRLKLKLPLRTPQPAGCTARVSGPLLAAAGMPLPAAQRVGVPAGREVSVTVPKVLTLAAAASSGCGFKVVVEVQAIQNQPTSAPTATPTTAPTTPPTTRPTTMPPTATSPTVQPPTVQPTTTPTIDPPGSEE